MNLAVIGYGGMAEHHIDYYIKRHNEKFPSQKIEISGIYDINEKRLRIAGQKNLRVYNTSDDIMRDTTVDAVLIATPNDVHCQYALTAAANKKHIICEKPIAMSVDEAQLMYDAAAQNGVHLFVHQNRRWDDDFLMAKNIVDNQQIGDVYGIESRVMGSNGIPGAWRKEYAKGGGMMLDWGVHLIDQMLFAVDSLVISVYCDFSYIQGEEVDDGFTACLKFDNGVSAIIAVDTNCFIPLPRWQISGINGTAVINNWDLDGKIVSVEVREDKGLKIIKAGNGFTKTMAERSKETVKEQPLEKIVSDNTVFYKNFCDCIKGDAQPIIKQEEVMRVFEIMELCFLSYKENKAISCEI